MIQLNINIREKDISILDNYKKGKNIIVKPCIIAQKTDDEKIIEFISKTKINCPDTKAKIEPTEYIGFNIEDKKISFEKII